MTLRLPRPRKRISSLDPVTAAALTAMRRESRATGGILTGTDHQLAQRLLMPPEFFVEVTGRLIQSCHLCRGRRGAIAVVTVVSAKLHAEKCANRKRRRAGIPASWPVRDAIAAEFPELVISKVSAKPAVRRPPGYVIPSAFATLIAAHDHHHLGDCPPNVERVTEAYYPGELSSLLTVIAEQESAGRPVVLLYTRKAVYLAIRRTPKR